MEVRRTAPVKLDVPNQRCEDFHESAQQFLHCANRAAEFCWDDTDYTECVTANSIARGALYDELRAETDLTANLVQEGIRRAVQAVKATASGLDPEVKPTTRNIQSYVASIKGMLSKPHKEWPNSNPRRSASSA